MKTVGFEPIPMNTGAQIQRLDLEIGNMFT